MKVVISYPPIDKSKGVPQISQNRFFKWFAKHSVIYPVIPAYAATMLRNDGFEVLWLDAVAEKLSTKQYFNILKEESPDLIAFEVKTPIMNFLWDFVDKVKKKLPDIKVVFFGDHVTALPKESFKYSKVDFVLTGGDYDFLLVNLAKHLSKGDKLEPGIFCRKGRNVVSSGRFKLDHDLKKLPLIDRELTKWELYAFDNGNFSRTPGTYTMAARDCWWGKCTFCSWPQMYPCYRTMTPKQLVDELEYLVNVHGVKEVMDDSGTFPVGEWLEEFCNLMIKTGLNKKIRIDCNMRFGILKEKDYELMKKAGFRLILYGLESANQKTLDRLKKGIKVRDIFEGAEWAKNAGLKPHLTCIVGYPWESFEDAQNTVNMAKQIFNNGWADTLQATIVMPYPGTGLYKYCKKNKLLKFDGARNWHRFDMREQVVKSSLSDSQVKGLNKDLYKLFFSPRYIFKKLVNVRSVGDVKFIIRGIPIVIKHIFSYDKGD